MPSVNNAQKSLSFFVTINKLTDELTLQEGGLISLKIPKQWQKPHSSVKNPALWVCHLPANFLGIIYISLYPIELVIKKNNPEREQREDLREEIDEKLENYNQEKENDLLTYKGALEPSSENDKERFYRCRLKLQKKKEEKQEVKSSSGSGVVIFLIILFIAIIGIAAVSEGFK